jgi:hypothetical protein
MAGPVDVVLLRGLLPDIGLRPGAVLHGRVLDSRTLLLEGARLAARLPDGVEPGQRLRLRVEEATPERVHLRVVEQPASEQSQPAPPPAAYALALPGGATARLYVGERDAGGGAAAGGPAGAVVVRYDSPRLGRLDIRLEPGAAAVHVAAGEPAERVRDAAAALRDALGHATGRPTQVTVHPRDEVLDVRA